MISFLYAHDTALLTTGESTEIIQDKLNHAFASSHDWFVDNKLCLNISKAKAMLLGTKQHVQNTAPICIQNGTEQVETVPHFKYLGMFLDSSLTFNKHVSYVRKKVYVRLRALGQLRHYISRKLALNIYKSLIIPHFDYADTCYDAMSKQNAQKLQILQNTCLRIA